LVLLDCQLILKIAVSPEDESNLLFKRCVVCFMRSDMEKVQILISDVSEYYTTFKELHGTVKSLYIIHPCP